MSNTNPIKTEGKLIFPGKTCSSCFSSGARRVILGKTPVKVTEEERRIELSLRQMEHIRGQQ